MTPQWFGWFGFVLGLAALGGALFGLQRLRVRHRDVVVPTTLFWKEAVDAARARTLLERFRHPWAYALVFAIAACLWGAIAGLHGRGDPDVEHLILIDGSAAMAITDQDGRARHEQAMQRAALAVESLPRDSTSVVWCGPDTLTLLGKGEPAALLSRRLRDLAPAAMPATTSRTLRQHALARRDRALSVLVLGGPALDESFRAELPDDVTVERVACAGERAAQNVGVTALAASEAVSGRYDRCDVFVELGGGTASGITATLDGRPFDGAEVWSPAAGETADPSRARFVLRDVPTDGAVLRVERVGGRDALPTDDFAELRLPRRRTLRIALAAELTDSPLAIALRADPGVRVVAADAAGDEVIDVYVAVDNAPTVGDAPSLRLVDPAAQAAAFLVVTDDDVVAEDAGQAETAPFDFPALLAGLGLDSIDAMQLASETQRTIQIDVAAGDVRSVSMWRELLDEDYDFVRSRSFPRFVGATVRWLAGEAPWPMPLLVAAPSVLGATHDAAGRTLDPLGAGFEPPTVGHYDDAVAAMLDPATTQIAARDVAESAEPAPTTPRGDLVTWLGVIALCLLCLEWILYRQGRMP